MRTIAFALLALSLAVGARAEESAWPMNPVKPNLGDKPSLQHGLKLFVNYCMGCH